jgi:regulator of protease activity HflC (stomatin/prohibitin superfamily)
MNNKEMETTALSGWVMLPLLIAAEVLVGVSAWKLIPWGGNEGAIVAGILLGLVPATVLIIVLAIGFFTLQPNMSAVLVLFGKYKGTVHASGFWWANPLLKKIKVSRRARNLNGERIKVNDQRGNPIEIAAVVVWHVEDTARAVFDVDHFEEYVAVQSEAALRHLASAYAYDTYESDDHLSLRGNMDEVSQALQRELTERVSRAGVSIEEARLSHLAYSPEIAGAMLQRQQADAVVAARTRIVDGAIGMVQMALERLDQDKGLALDEERKAAMVSNLLVVLCGDKSAQPVVNTGTLYT